MIDVIEKREKHNTVKNTKGKETQIELLRIIAMILIIIHHYVYHGGILDVHLDGINKLISIFVVLGGKIGVNLFVLISGYFLINKKFKIKRILKLLFEVYFYSILIFIINIILKNEIKPEMIFNTFLPFNIYWFFKVYLVLSILSPIINLLIKKISNKQYILLITILFCMVCIIGPLGKIRIFANSYMIFLLMYLIRGYVKLYKFHFKTVWDKRDYSFSTLFVIIFNKL